MANNELFSALLEVDPANWIGFGDSVSALEWLPLVQISSSGLWAGLDRNGEWVVGRLGERVVTSPDGPPQPWVTMLDMVESEFRSNLKLAATRYRLPDMTLQETVPVDDVLAMAIKSGSKHWADRAVSWMSARPIRGEDLYLLRELAEAKWASQQTRHTARHLVKNHGRDLPT